MSDFLDYTYTVLGGSCIAFSLVLTAAQLFKSSFVQSLRESNDTRQRQQPSYRDACPESIGYQSHPAAHRAQQ